MTLFLFFLLLLLRVREMCMDAWIASIWFTQSTCPPYMRIITVTTAGSAHIIGNTRLFKPWGGGCVRYIKLHFLRYREDNSTFFQLTHATLSSLIFHAAIQPSRFG